MIEAVLELPGPSLAAVQRTHQPFWTPLLSFDDSPGHTQEEPQVGENSCSRAITEIRAGWIVKTRSISRQGGACSIQEAANDPHVG